MRNGPGMMPAVGAKKQMKERCARATRISLCRHAHKCLSPPPFMRTHTHKHMQKHMQDARMERVSKASAPRLLEAAQAEGVRCRRQLVHVANIELGRGAARRL